MPLKLIAGSLRQCRTRKRQEDDARNSRKRRRWISGWRGTNVRDVTPCGPRNGAFAGSRASTNNISAQCDQALNRLKELVERQPYRFKSEP